MVYKVLVLFIVIIATQINICCSQQPQQSEQQNLNLKQLCLFHANHTEIISHANNTEIIYHPERVQKMVSNVPRTIWQTHKTDRIPSQTQQFVRNWVEMNPEYTYRFLNQMQISDLIMENLEIEMVQFYNKLKVQKERSDFERILILYLYGGVYADLDVQPIRPIREWDHYPFDKFQLILSVESGESLQQKVFVSSKGHPFLAELLRLYYDNHQHDDALMEQNPLYILNYEAPIFWSRALLSFCKIDPQIDQSQFQYGDFIWQQFNKPDSQMRKCCDQNKIDIEDNRYFSGTMTQYVSQADKWKDCKPKKSYFESYYGIDARQQIRKFRKGYNLCSEQEILYINDINEIKDFIKHTNMTEYGQLNQFQKTISPDQSLAQDKSLDLIKISFMVSTLLLFISTLVLARKLSSKNKQKTAENAKNGDVELFQKQMESFSVLRDQETNIQQEI